LLADGDYFWLFFDDGWMHLKTRKTQP
jgi:hypothetical protein